MNEQERYESVCQPAFERLEAADGQHAQKLDEVLALLRGNNGDGGGVLGRLRSVEEKVGAHTTTITVHDMALYGKPDNKDDQGLLGDCRDLRRRAARTDKVAWTAISAAIAQAFVWIKGWLGGG
jgi:hypothetical protein